MTELTVAERALLERFLEALRELPEVRAEMDVREATPTVS